MNRAIRVPPAAEGWSPTSTAYDIERDVRSAEELRAETPDLGPGVARVSAAVMIEVFLRDGSLAGRYVSTPRGWRPL